MRTSQTRSWSVSFRRGSFWRRLIGKPPGEVEELAAYSTFARIATSMSSDPLVPEVTLTLFRHGGAVAVTPPPAGDGSQDVRGPPSRAALALPEEVLGGALVLVRPPLGLPVLVAA